MKLTTEPVILTADDFLLRPPDVAEHLEVLELGLDAGVRLWNPHSLLPGRREERLPA